MKKRILCFGDSITWGYDPQTGTRFDEDTRWTGVLQNLLGNEYAIVEEGLNSRTTVIDDLYQGVMSGLTYLEPCLKTHKPIDLIIIMLGTNDAKNIYNAHAERIAKGCKRLIKLAQNSNCGIEDTAPKILLIAPPIIKESKVFSEVFDDSSIEKTKQFAYYYNQVAKQENIYFMDASKYVVSSDIDGIHLDADQHKLLAETISEKVKEILI